MLTSARLLLLSFVAGAAGLVLEIAAPRLAAPYVGTGALAWTVAIATFLAGLALGNAVGGRLSDRGTRGLLPALLFGCALLSLATPWLNDVARSFVGGLSLDLRTLVALPIAFLPVSILLGTVPPALARTLLQRGESKGLRLGAVAATGAAGSVLGAFLSGFVLVPAWGLRGVFLGTAAALAAAAVLAPWGSRSAAVARDSGSDSDADIDRDDAGTMRPRRQWVVLSAVAGASILTLEILAGRFAADRLGASIYTWTSVIGVVLAGLALGALLGGRLADALRPRVLLGWLLLLASVSSGVILWSHVLLGYALEWANAGTLAYPQAVLAACALTYFLPALVLGTISPVVIRAALTEPRADGRIVGVLYAAGTLGAVAAAVLVGYLVIPWFGLERLALFLVFGLGSAAGVVRGRQPYLWHGVVIVAAVVMHGPWIETRPLARHVDLLPADTGGTLDDSRYSRIRVLPESVAARSVPIPRGLDTVQVWVEPVFDEQGLYNAEKGRLEWRGRMTDAQRERLLEMVPPGVAEQAVERLYELTRHDRRRLRLDRLVHGYVDLQDPLWLGYGYERLYAVVLDRLWPERSPVRCLFIGGGAYAMQRYVLARYPDQARLVSAEIDPMVTAIATRHLGLAEDARHRIVHEDARTVVDGWAREDGALDIVFGDAFAHVAVPFHLTTTEFDASLKQAMAPDGVYLVNVLDSWESGLFLSAFIRTLEQSFTDVRVVTAVPRLRNWRTAFVVVASNTPLDGLGTRFQNEQGEVAIVLPREEVEELLRRTGAEVLTDDRAPVELLLAPVVHSR